MFPRSNPITKKKLETGDYSVKGYEQHIAIERKSMADYYGCCAGPAANRTRFAKQLERLAGIPFAILVVEGNLSKHTFGSAGGDGQNLDRLLIMTSVYLAEYNVPIMFLDNRHLATDFAYHYLYQSNERISDQWQRSQFPTPIYRTTRRAPGSGGSSTSSGFNPASFRPPSS